MNENINLSEILKGHEGESFYSPVLGTLIFVQVIYPSVRFKTAAGAIWDINSTGKIYNNTDELCVFPSKDQRDWNKWVEENKPKPKIPKTWSDLERLDEITEYGAEIVRTFNNRWWDSTKSKTPIEKSALALFKIHQLIEVGYGGNVTNEEWEKAYIISCTADKIFTVHATNCIHTIAFHTKEQAEEFLSYPENAQLLKDYFML